MWLCSLLQTSLVIDMYLCLQACLAANIYSPQPQVFFLFLFIVCIQKRLNQPHWEDRKRSAEKVDVKVNTIQIKRRELESSRRIMERSWQRTCGFAVNNISLGFLLLLAFRNASFVSGFSQTKSCDQARRFLCVCVLD